MHVNKDLVIWGKPGMTCWDRMPAPDEKLVPKNWPLRIIEWKRAKSHRDARRDCEWLLDFCRRAPKSFCGYSVVLGAGQGEERIHCTRVSRDTVQENWI